MDCGGEGEVAELAAIAELAARAECVLAQPFDKNVVRGGGTELQDNRKSFDSFAPRAQSLRMTKQNFEGVEMR
jgi:hypothetical protein